MEEEYLFWKYRFVFFFNRLIFKNCRFVRFSMFTIFRLFADVDLTNFCCWQLVFAFLSHVQLLLLKRSVFDGVDLNWRCLFQGRTTFHHSNRSNQTMTLEVGKDVDRQAKKAYRRSYSRTITSLTGLKTFIKTVSSWMVCLYQCLPADVTR